MGNSFDLILCLYSTNTNKHSLQYAKKDSIIVFPPLSREYSINMDDSLMDVTGYIIGKRNKYFYIESANGHINRTKQNIMVADKYLEDNTYIVTKVLVNNFFS